MSMPAGAKVTRYPGNGFVSVQAIVPARIPKLARDGGHFLLADCLIEAGDVTIKGIKCKSKVMVKAWANIPKSHMEKVEREQSDRKMTLRSPVLW